jgi:large subunit ribosomal protein L25
MDIYKLESQSRDTRGKQSTRKLRSAGRIPAILYGHKEAPMSLTIDEAQMRTILTKQPDSPIVDLTLGGTGEVNALVREIQRHPATGKLLHIDFQRISLDEQVRVDVPIEVQGEPIGVKDQGGMLEHGTRSLTVECLPREIPDSIVIDVSQLSIGDAVKLSDVQERYPSLEFDAEPELTLATVVPPRLEVEPEPAEGVEGEAAEPEVISDKDEDEGEGKDESKD